MTQPKLRRNVGRLAFVVTALGAGLAIGGRRWSPVRVSGASMEPTLPEGALVAVSPVRGDPSFGCVVVVRRPDGSEHLKRVTGAPGDRVRLENGTFTRLDPDRFTLAGDNRDRSTDSRHYGPVGRREIVAIVRVCYWPPRAWRSFPRA